MSISKILNNRAVLIVIALALPVAVFVALKPSGPKPQPSAASSLPSLDTTAIPQTPGKPGDTLEGARARIKQRIGELEKMTDAQWKQELKEHPNRPATVQDAIDLNTRRMQALEQMTPEQWNAQQVSKAPGKTWESMTPQEKLLIVQDQEKKLEQIRQQLLMQTQGTGGVPPTVQAPQ